MSAYIKNEVSEERMAQIWANVAEEMRPLCKRLHEWKCPKDVEGDFESMVFVKFEALKTGEVWHCEKCREEDICREHEVEVSLEEMEQILLGDTPDRLPGE